MARPADNQGEGRPAPDGSASLPPEAQVRHGADDPLKQRAIDLYRARLTRWFNARWDQRGRPRIPCDELRSLQARTQLRLQGRTIVRGHILETSGNRAFDDFVVQTLITLEGQMVPEPPPIYPDLLGREMHPVFSGRAMLCEDEPLE